MACAPTTESHFAFEGRKHQDSLQQKEHGGHWGRTNGTMMRFYFERNATELLDINHIPEAVVGLVQLSIPLRCLLSSPPMGGVGAHWHFNSPHRTWVFCGVLGAEMAKYSWCGKKYDRAWKLQIQDWQVLWPSTSGMLTQTIKSRDSGGLSLHTCLHSQSPKVRNSRTPMGKWEDMQNVVKKTNKETNKQTNKHRHAHWKKPATYMQFAVKLRQRSNSGFQELWGRRQGDLLIKDT